MAQSEQDILGATLQTINDFVSRQKDSELDKTYKEYSSWVSKTIDKTLKGMKQMGIQMPSATYGLKMARIVLTAAQLAFPAQGETPDKLDLLKTVRDGITQTIKDQGKELRTINLKESNKAVVAETVLSQVQRLVDALRGNDEFKKKLLEYQKDYGIHEIKDYYPLRVVMANIFTSNSLVLAHNGLHEDKDFLEKVAEKLTFPVELQDIIERNRAVEGGALGIHKLTFAKDAPNEPQVEAHIAWLYKECKPIQDLQAQLGDNEHLRMFEALLEGDTESDIYKKAKAEFKLEWLKDINWDLVEVAESTSALDAEELERMQRLGVEQKKQKFV